MKTVYEEALEKHLQWKGKFSIENKMPIENKQDLSIAYTPGVAEPCKAIHRDPEKVYDYTWKGNVVAVISDGSAVLGLGNIGPYAGLPVMEGKCALFKRFAGLNAVPIMLESQDTETIIETIKQIAPSFGGINLEDISAPRCVEIERRLIEELDIPVFHDDQHGTAIVVASALMNSARLLKKEVQDFSVTVSGTGAAGSSIIKMLSYLGIKEIYAFNIDGIVRVHEKNDSLLREISSLTNRDNEDLSMAQALQRSNVFIGVSGPNILTKEMVQDMKGEKIIFAMANPEPEISYDLAKEGGATIVGTGRSDYPNQVNNVLAFPGIFKGALEIRADKITEEMKVAAARGIASLVSDEELNQDYVIPPVFDPRVADVVAQEVRKCYLENRR